MYLDWYKIASFLRCLSISGTFPKRSVVTLTKCIGVYFLECTQFTHLLSFVSLFGIRDMRHFVSKTAFSIVLFTLELIQKRTFSAPPISGAFQVDCTNHLVQIYLSTSPVFELAMVMIWGPTIPKCLTVRSFIDIHWMPKPV